jgi:hypothetical protein
MALVDLTNELASEHPITGAYDADHQVAADQINAVNIPRPKTSLSGNELFTSTHATEFAGLSDAKKQMWVSWCNADRDPTNTANIAFVDFIFGDSSTTMSNLASIRTENISRAVELGLGVIKAGQVEEARR